MKDCLVKEDGGEISAGTSISQETAKTVPSSWIPIFAHGRRL